MCENEDRKNVEEVKDISELKFSKIVKIFYDDEDIVCLDFGRVIDKEEDMGYDDCIYVDVEECIEILKKELKM